MKKTSTARRGRHASAWKSVVLDREQQFLLKRGALLREAGRAFSLRGYHNTSLEDVAKTLDVTKAALYYYVTNKQEILFECHMMSLDFGDEAMKYSEEHGKTGLEKILLLIDKYVKTITSEMGSFAVLGEYDALESQNKAIIGKRRDKFDRGFRKLISEGIADGTVRAVDPKLTVFFFMGSINWMTRWFTTEGPLTGEQVARQLVDLVEGALRSR
ncbi:MAG: TetR family transcriptional regulator [Bradyrhizobium sp.]|jgi:AcrR family transcriptional regulator|uniref:TetR/AcrR family transcriptional regulator n=1 Tax=Bradyrhizobium TaxID=374 RepID=UPI00040C3BB6|nr:MULTISPECIES: TetR/AcrR family transcriptional regulator [Bradyrhizobium]MBJ7403334.1 TetR family transcriptional regulator [Bradyrhizobium sp.]